MHENTVFSIHQSFVKNGALLHATFWSLKNLLTLKIVEQVWLSVACVKTAPLTLPKALQLFLYIGKKKKKEEEEKKITGTVLL